MDAICIDKEKALALAENLSVPSHSNGLRFVTFDRLNKIEEELSETAYRFCVDGGIYRLYSQKTIDEIDGKILLVSSHADCLQRYPVFLERGEKHQKRMIGIFDNAITNAACVYLMKYCTLPENVVFAFNGDEESEDDTQKLLSKLGLEYLKTEEYLRELRMEDGLDEDDEPDMMGVYAVCRYLKNLDKEFNALVLDCTYSGFSEKADFTLENDFIYEKDRMWLEGILACLNETDLNWKFIPADEKQKTANEDEYVSFSDIMEMLSEDHLNYEDDEIEEAGEDESYEFDRRDVSCISLCLPCDAEDMHRKRGFGIRRKNYYNYIRILHALCQPA